MGAGRGEEVPREAARDRIFAPAKQGGARGGAEKKNRPGVTPGEGSIELGSGVRGVLQEGCHGAPKGASAQKARRRGTRTWEGEGRRPGGPGTSTSRAGH